MSDEATWVQNEHGYWLLEVRRRAIARIDRRVDGVGWLVSLGMHRQEAERRYSLLRPSLDEGKATAWAWWARYSEQLIAELRVVAPNKWALRREYPDPVPPDAAE